MAFDALFEERFAEMLVKGRDLGWLSPDMVVDAMAHVELSTGLIDAVVARIRAQGIEYRDETPDERVVDESPGGTPVRPVAPTGSSGGPTRSTEPLDPEPPPDPKPRSAQGVSTPKRSTVAPDAVVRSGRASLVRGTKPSVRRNGARGMPGEDSRTALTSDPVHAYLKEIGKVRLLSPGEEVDVARRIAAGLRAGDRIMELREQFAPGAAPRAELDAQFQILSDGLQAKALLVESNLRLVVSIAKRHRVRGMLLLDLIQEGNLGLIRAVEKFDYTRGFRFSTYATWWIRQAINRAIAEQARTIRIPAHMVEVINRVTRIQYQLVQEEGHEPSVEELARLTELSVERIQEILRINQEPVSIDQPVGGEDEITLSDVIEDRCATVPADAAARALLNEAVSRALEELSEREQEIVRLRFGLDDGQVRTLEEVGKVIGLTRERIRQIEVKTLAKLRYPISCQPLRDYLDES